MCSTINETPTMSGTRLGLNTVSVLMTKMEKGEDEPDVGDIIP